MAESEPEECRSKSSVQMAPEEVPEPVVGNYTFAELFVVPENLAQSVKELVDDLAEVPVKGTDGRATDIFEKIESESMFESADKQLIWSCLAIVRDAFKNLDRDASLKDQEIGYQWNMNWKH